MICKKLVPSLGLIMISAMLFTSTVFAHGDEDHSGDEKPAAVISTGLQTGASAAEAQSDDFELLAQLKGNTLQVFLDRYSDNAPIEKAQIEVESGSFKAQLKAISPGEYAVAAPALAEVGEHALVFTIVTSEQSDLLETTLKVAKPAPALGAEHSSAASAMGWWIGGGLLVLAALILVLTRQRRLRRKLSGPKI